MVRDVAGVIGSALLTAALLGGALAWIGPVAYLGVAMPALGAGWTTPWIWPARPPDDRGAAICAALVFAAGLAVITVRGARDSARE
jgi:amino acid transporter